jgi:hypothetical protein
MKTLTEDDYNVIAKKVTNEVFDKIAFYKISDKINLSKPLVIKTKNESTVDIDSFFDIPSYDNKKIALLLIKHSNLNSEAIAQCSSSLPININGIEFKPFYFAPYQSAFTINLVANKVALQLLAGMYCTVYVYFEE